MYVHVQFCALYEVNIKTVSKTEIMEDKEAMLKINQSKKVSFIGHVCLLLQKHCACRYIVQYPSPPQHGQLDIIRGGNNYADYCFQLFFSYEYVPQGPWFHPIKFWIEPATRKT